MPVWKQKGKDCECRSLKCSWKRVWLRSRACMVCIKWAVYCRSLYREDLFIHFFFWTNWSTVIHGKGRIWCSIHYVGVGNRLKQELQLLDVKLSKKNVKWFCPHCCSCSKSWDEETGNINEMGTKLERKELRVWDCMTLITCRAVGGWWRRTGKFLFFFHLLNPYNVGVDSSWQLVPGLKPPVSTIVDKAFKFNLFVLK